MPVPRKSRLYAAIDASPDVILHHPYTRVFDTINEPFCSLWPIMYVTKFVRLIKKTNRAILKTNRSDQTFWTIVLLKPVNWMTIDPYILIKPDVNRICYTCDKNGPIGYRFDSYYECKEFIKKNRSWL